MIIEASCILEMRPLNSLLLDLSALDRSKSNYFSEFERILSNIIAFRDPSSIVPLTRLFDDEPEFDELMFSIIHGIEVFDHAIYISSLLSSAHSLCRKSPRWASIVFMRILNSEAARLELVRQLRSADTQVKEEIKLLMEKINARSPKFLAKTTVVILASTPH